MNRRGFLQGIIASAAGSEALVRLATPVEAAFVKDEPVILGSQALVPSWDPRQPFAYVYVRGEHPEAKYELLGYAKSFSVTAQLDSLMEFEISGFVDGQAFPGSSFRSYSKNHRW